MIELLRARRELDARARWSREEADYVAANRINPEAVNAHAGLLTVTNCEFFGNGYFAFADDHGVRSAVIEVYGEDDETSVDICAWALDRAGTFATMFGSDALGAARVSNPATWAFGGVLKIFRTPLKWLQAGCQGCCILDHRYVSIWLREAVGYGIEVEDEEHGLQLAAMLNPPRFDERRLLVPTVPWRRAA